MIKLNLVKKIGSNILQISVSEFLIGVIHRETKLFSLLSLDGIIKREESFTTPNLYLKSNKKYLWVGDSKKITYVFHDSENHVTSSELRLAFYTDESNLSIRRIEELREITYSNNDNIYRWNTSIEISIGGTNQYFDNRIFYPIVSPRRKKSLKEGQSTYEIGMSALKCKNVRTGDTLWIFDLPERFKTYIDHIEKYLIDKINEIICCYEGIIWIKLAGGQLLGLDLQTGELEHEIGRLHRVNDPLPQHDSFFTANMYMEEEAKIVSISTHAYTEFDLNTNKHYIYPIEFPAGYEDEHIDRCESIDERYLYFTRGWIHSLFGVYDRKEKKIAFIDRFTNDKGEPAGVKSFQANQDYFYILERNGPLYIYENPLEY